MHLPINLPDNSQVLIAGAGGGYDVVCALPLAIWLKAHGHGVHFASYSFSRLQDIDQLSMPFPGVYEVVADSPPPVNGYLPEGYLAQWWLQEFDERISVWSYREQGVKPLARILAELCRHLELDAIIMLDAGVDGLFEGTEHDIGTPAIDNISILAAYQLNHIKRFYISTAFGTEGRKHTVRHADALMRISQQIALGGLIDVTALTPQTPIGQGFLAAAEFIHQRQGPEWKSNMVSSIVAAMKGKFGHHDLTLKTTEAPIWVSPLTLLYWIFDLEMVAQTKPFFEKAKETESVEEMVELIQDTRNRFPTLPRLDIPI